MVLPSFSICFISPIKFDIVFLDGDHNYFTVYNELHLLQNLLHPRSVIICDDYNVTEYGVRKAVDEIKDNCGFKDLGRFAFLKIKN